MPLPFVLSILLYTKQWHSASVQKLQEKERNCVGPHIFMTPLKHLCLKIKWDVQLRFKNQSLLKLSNFFHGVVYHA